MHEGIRVIAIAVAVAGAAIACGQSTPQATTTVTVTSSAATTTSRSSATTATPSTTTTTPSTTTKTTTTTSEASNAIVSVEVVSRKGNGIVTDVGPGLYELPTYPSDINPPEVTFDWTSHGTEKDITTSGCTVVADITGPNGYNERRRSSDCSGSPNSDLSVMVAGTYSISVEVTPPDGGAPVTGTGTFKAIPKGS